MLTLEFISDPGHGWLRTSYQFLKELELTKKISHYSYRNGDAIYLEEDQDANILIDTLKEKNIPFKIIDTVYTDSDAHCRNYRGYYQSIY